MISVCGSAAPRLVLCLSSSLSFGFFVGVLVGLGSSSLSGSTYSLSFGSSSEAMPLAELCLYHVRARRTLNLLLLLIIVIDR